MVISCALSSIQQHIGKWFSLSVQVSVRTHEEETEELQCGREEFGGMGLLGYMKKSKLSVEEKRLMKAKSGKWPGIKKHQMYIAGF